LRSAGHGFAELWVTVETALLELAETLEEGELVLEGELMEVLGGKVVGSAADGDVQADRRSTAHAARAAIADPRTFDRVVITALPR